MGWVVPVFCTEVDRTETVNAPRVREVEGRSCAALELIPMVPVTCPSALTDQQYDRFLRGEHSTADVEPKVQPPERYGADVESEASLFAPGI